MADGLGLLLLLVAALGVSSYAAGYLPLTLSLTGRQLRLLTALGTGILVGTALIVIIPEGVETLYNAADIARSRSPAHAVKFARSPLSDFDTGLQPASRAAFQAVPQALIRRADASADGSTLTGPDDGRPPSSAKDALAMSENFSQLSAQQESTHDEFEPHLWSGIALIAGFVLMYLIDKLPKSVSSTSHLRPSYISLQGMGFRSGEGVDTGQDGGGHDEDRGGFRPTSTTTGLVIHAAADGIALGASSAPGTSKLSLIIFVALMIHKAPAAFGLTSVLLKQGLSKRQARTHLIIFSLSAPVSAIATWAVARMVARAPFSEGARTGFLTGMLLLFSGGTFLYVAMHAMQDAGHEHNDDDQSHQSRYTNMYQQQSGPSKDNDGPVIWETLATVSGMFLPLLTQFGHGH